MLGEDTTGPGLGVFITHQITTGSLGLKSAGKKVTGVPHGSENPARGLCIQCTCTDVVYVCVSVNSLILSLQETPAFQLSVGEMTQPILGVF